jgi:hypothetical protein
LPARPTGHHLLRHDSRLEPTGLTTAETGIAMIAEVQINNSANPKARYVE